jgi:hypothetical protein
MRACGAESVLDGCDKGRRNCAALEDLLKLSEMPELRDFYPDTDRDERITPIVGVDPIVSGFEERGESR